jgi:hypothetical protein
MCSYFVQRAEPSSRNSNLKHRTKRCFKFVHAFFNKILIYLGDYTINSLFNRDNIKK